MSTLKVKSYILSIALTGFVSTPTRAEENFALELDLLPYITGGYYGSVSWLHESWRYRAIIADVNLPKFLIPNDFDRHNQWVAALVLDYFYQHQLAGWWTGIGFEYWRNTVRERSTGESAQFRQSVVTVGQGYVWRFSEHFYLNPWVALHVPLQTETQTIGGKAFKPLPILGEASLKIGYVF